MLRKGILMILTLIPNFVFSLSYDAINTDYETIAAMTAAYATEIGEESLYEEQLDSIYKSYKSSETAMAGIFASKYLDQKALKSPGIFMDKNENYYYVRIYNLVASKIMPKIWTVAGLMLHSPSSALYWVSYLGRVCTEVESLCKQFASVVTNYTMSFDGITFLRINMNLTKHLGLDDAADKVEQLISQFEDLTSGKDKDFLASSIDVLYNLGVGIASAGATNLMSSILGQNSFASTINNNISQMISSIEEIADLLDVDDKASKILTDLGITEAEGIGNLFAYYQYDIDDWISDYLSQDNSQYYTQTWYIYSHDAGSEVMYSYYPNITDEALSSSEWYKITTSESSYYPTEAERETILQNSESYSGLSRQMVNELNALNDGYTYKFNSNLWSEAYIKKKTGETAYIVYAYEITITKSWDFTDVVYENTFNSYTMDLSSFMQTLQVRLQEYNLNEEGITYTLASGPISYYEVPDATTLSAIQTVTISETCHDGEDFSSGDTQYKCRKESSSLSAHTKECAMLTSVSLDDLALDLTELNDYISSLQAQISSLEGDIESVNAEIERLKELINSNPTSMERAEYVSQLNNKRDELSSLTSQKSALESDLQDALDAKAEAESDDEETDDYYRIPAIMEDCKRLYGLSWQGDGYWNDYTYVRQATMSNLTGLITFEAEVTMERKPKYFLGILIHRAIIKIKWTIKADYDNTTIVDILTFDDSMTIKEKQQQCALRISEIALEYPDCDMDVQYEGNEGLAKEDDSSGQHLLWMSNRIDVARRIEARLSTIYTQLIFLEKFLHYKVNIVDYLRKFSPYINDTYGKHKSIAEEALERWRNNSYKAIGKDAPGEKVESPN